MKDTYDLCLTNKPARDASGASKEAGKQRESQEPAVAYEGLERIYAAVGLPSSPAPARRPILSDQLFESPRHTPDLEAKAKATPADAGGLVPPPAAAPLREKQPVDPSGPLMKLPYPFTGYGAQVSNEDVVPFPPSPAIEGREVDAEAEGTHDEGEEYVEGEEGEEEEEEEEESEVPSSERRTSGSMSSLGRPVASRYPFQFRRPRGSSSASHMTPRTHSTQTGSTPSRSTQSRSTRHSRSTQSTGNMESTDSHSPRTNSSSNVSPLHSSFSGSMIPMPPRHPQAQQVQRRARAGTVPASPGSPSPVVFPGGRPRARTRTESMITDPSATFGPIPIGSFDSEEEDEDEHDHEHEHDHDLDESLMEVPEPEGSIEEAERQDSVGLLSAAPSPRASLANLRHRASGLAGARRRSHGSRSNSGASQTHSSRSRSRSRTNSTTSLSEAARSRAQSFIQSLGAASRSSIELVRSRTNSLGHGHAHGQRRHGDSPYASTSSDAVLSSPENHTFGHPLREQWRADEYGRAVGDDMSDIAESVAASVARELASGSGTGLGVTVHPADDDEEPTTSSAQELHSARSTISREAPSEISAVTERGGMPIPGREGEAAASTSAVGGAMGLLGVPGVHHEESMPDLSTAPQSFITVPTTHEDTTSSSGRTQRTWGTMEHYTHGTDWHAPM